MSAQPTLHAWLQAAPVLTYLLDREGIVLAQSRPEPSLQAWLPDNAVGRDFFRDILVGGEVPELGGAFHAAMDAPDLTLEVDLDWQLGGEQDVAVRLRRIADGDDVWGLVVLEDQTRLKTTERALAAAFGEAHERDLTDPVTGLFTRRQFDFVLPIELRRGARYGYGTAVLGIEASTLPLQAREPGIHDSMALRVADRPLEPTELHDVAQRLLQTTRQTDVVFHFQPSRFHLVLTHTDPAGAQIAATRLAGNLQQITWPNRRLVLRMALVGLGPEVKPADYARFGEEVLEELAAKLGQQA